MPFLSSIGKSGHCEPYANNVYFFMTYGGHRIRCGITDLALEILATKRRSNGQRTLSCVRCAPRLKYRAQAARRPAGPPMTFGKIARSGGVPPIGCCQWGRK